MFFVLLLKSFILFLLLYFTSQISSPKVSNHIARVMVSVLASNAVDRGFEPRSGQTKDNSTQHKGERAKTGWRVIRIMCPSGATCLSADCCFTELAL